MQDLAVRSGKSEAEVTNNRRQRSRYCTVELTTDRNEASRGLSATAELLVWRSDMYFGSISAHYLTTPA